jgi:GxxExxY protein
MSYEQDGRGEGSYGGGRGDGRGDGRGRGRGGYRGGRDDRRDDRRGIPLSALDAATTESSRKLIGAAIEVHKALGPGYDATAYANALKIELADAGVVVKHGHQVDVMYKGKKISETSTDLCIDSRFFVDVLARPGQISTFERLALRAKLKASDLELGLIINFAERRLKDGLVRVVNIEKIQREKGLEFGDDVGEPEHDDGM